MIDWEYLRTLHLGDYEGIYLNSAANGIPSIEAEKFVSVEIEKYRKAPGKYRMNFIAESIPAIKRQVANLINANQEEVALVQKLSIAINLWVKDLPRGTKVAFYRGDYPSLTKPFEVGDFDVRWLDFEQHEINLDTLEEFLNKERPNILGLSHVQWTTGYVADFELIGQLCKKFDCLLMVDATQSLGSLSIDVQKCNIDVLGASAYKWPLAGFGNGIFYLSNSIQQKYPPHSAGFNSYVWENGETQYYPSMKSYEPGHHDHVAFHRLGFALSQIKKIGLENITIRINRLMSYLIQELNDIGISPIGSKLMKHRGGILCVKSKPGLLKHLLSKNIEVSERGGFIRLGLHYYNNEGDIDVLVKEVERFNL
jgi:selenocysteine lyase/cysteine desulfurase